VNRNAPRSRALHAACSIRWNTFIVSTGNTHGMTLRIMPPKSTWFEPKLRSGLFVHRL